MKKQMLINVLQAEECRIAIVENGVLEELYVERASQESYVNNIYKGRIVNIEPSIQAAFVDFGIGRNGFLHVSDVDPVYYKHLVDARGNGDRGGRGGRGNGNDRGPRGPRVERDHRRSFEPVTIPGTDEETGFFETEELIPEQPAMEMTGFLEPAAPIEEGPQEIEDYADGDEEEAFDFGAGLDLDVEPMIDTRDEPKQVFVQESFIPEVIEVAPREVKHAPTPTEPTEAEVSETTETEEVAETPVKKKPAARTRKRPAAEAATETTEARPKRRKTTKKKETSSSEDDDQTLPVPSAERRTTDEEPELGDGGFVFDPFAPNDRFEEGVEASGESAYLPVTSEDDDSASVQEFDEESEDTSEGPFDDGPDGEADGPPEFGGHRGGHRGRDDRGGRGGPRGRDDRGGRGGPRGRDDRGGRGGPRGGRSFGRDGKDAAPKPPIQEIFKRGQEVIVQVIKEGIGTKGPTLSTYISIAGRYLVLMPSLNRLAVSRKIGDETTRGRLKEILSTLTPPKGIGFIIRTAAIDRNKEELQKDLAYLVRLWEVFARRTMKMPAPVEIYRESDMITRTIRDIFTSDIDAIWVDEPNAFAQAQEFLNIVMPRYADRIKYYGEVEPLFHHFRIEEEIAKIQEKKVPLAMGGSIVIEQTEALVAIDVNSGNFRAENNAEETAYQMNLQAAKEIGRQLRLRDLGGVIVNDFIDMKDEKHRRNVENALRDALRRDRARTKILRTSQFGVIEMTRQRIRPSLKRSIFVDCPHCRATGFVKTGESMSIELMRLFQLASSKQTIRKIEAKVHFDVASYLLNKRRKEIMHWEEMGKMQLQIAGLTGVSPEFFELQAFDGNGHEVRFLPTPVIVAPRAHVHPERRDDRDDRRDDSRRDDRRDDNRRDDRREDNRRDDGRRDDRRGGPGGGHHRGGNHRGGNQRSGGGNRGRNSY
jgi:ribonuclease E